MSLEEVHVNASETVSKVPYVRAPVAASVFDDANNSSGSSLSGESVFRDLIAFVNPGSGGRQGSALVRDLRALIGADRVFAIGKVNGVLQQPIDFLAPAVSGRSHPLRVVVCGGDGTVAWVISDADQLVQPHPGIQVFIIPLGTGNDLARAMLCGGGYTGRNLNDLRSVLHRSLSAMPVLLDRWELNFQFSGAPDRRRQLFNYFSVGLDARIARRFHDARESNPRLFFAQSFNKLLYGCFACRQCCDSLPPVSSYIDLFVDGQIIDLSNDFKGLIFLNIGSYAGGRKLWQHSELSQTHISDSMASAPATRVLSLFFRTHIIICQLEIVGVRSIVHMSWVTVCRAAATPLRQGSSIELKFKPASIANSSATFQIDGEPFVTPLDGKVVVTQTSKSTMLQCHDQPSSWC